MLNYIPDGYTERAYIEAAENLHGALSFAFRPLLPEERDALDEAQIHRPAREAANLVAAALTRALVEWDLRDVHGCPLPVGLEYVRRLRPPLFDKLHAVVACRAPSDPPPRQTPAEEADFIERLVAAAGTGCTPCELGQEADQKN